MTTVDGRVSRRVPPGCCVVALVLGGLATTDTRSDASSQPSPSCGPARAVTVSQSSRARVYRQAGDVWLGGRGVKKRRDLGVDEESCVGGSGGCYAIKFAA